MNTASTLLHIVFNPSSPTGYLFYSGNSSHFRDFLSLALVEGRLELLYDLGSGVASLSSAPLLLNIWHSVFVSREGRSAVMTVNGVEYGPVQSPGSLSQLNVQETVSLGGLRDYNILSPLADMDITGFTGCIRTLVVRIELVTESISMCGLGCSDLSAPSPLPSLLPLPPLLVPHISPSFPLTSSLPTPLPHFFSLILFPLFPPGLRSCRKVKP